MSGYNRKATFIRDAMSRVVNYIKVQNKAYTVKLPFLPYIHIWIIIMAKEVITVLNYAIRYDPQLISIHLTHNVNEILSIIATPSSCQYYINIVTLPINLCKKNIYLLLNSCCIEQLVWSHGQKKYIVFTLI